MKHSHAKVQLLYFCSDRLLNSSTMAGFIGECFKDAGTLLNLSASLFRDYFAIRCIRWVSVCW